MTQHDDTATTTHHRPHHTYVAPAPTATDDAMTVFTRHIARNLAARLAAQPDAIGFWRFPATAPTEVDGWTRHEITIGGHGVVIIGTPDHMGIPQYRVTVDDQDAPYRYTLDRPLAELLADAAYDAITAKASA